LWIESNFIEVRRPNPRFVAACASSALALCHEKDNHVNRISDTDALREQTCEWLTTVLHAQVHAPPMSLSGRNWLSHEFASWQLDPGLADLRDSTQLESSRPEFRSECTALWRLLNHDIVVLQVAKPSAPSTRRS
jgi:hypothetical protein